MWIEAKTYAKIAPHEYIVQEDEPAVYDKYEELIKKYGKDEEFTLHGKTNTYKYYYEGDYKYWVIENILNRVKI
jgi:hypothetical protein